MAKPKPRVKIPKTAARGEAVTIKTLINHAMESGHRTDPDSGNLVPRKILHSFECSYDGAPVFACDLAPAISANPYLAFKVRITKSGTFVFRWTDDDGSVYVVERSIEVV